MKENMYNQEINSEKGQENSMKKLDVLLIKPRMYPQQVQIDSGLRSLQQAVDGNIEAAYYFEEPVALIVNEEGKLNGSELNRAIFDQEGKMIDIIAGDFLVVGLGDEDFCSLPPELMKHMEARFHQPEVFVRVGGNILVLPWDSEEIKTN